MARSLSIAAIVLLFILWFNLWGGYAGAEPGRASPSRDAPVVADSRIHQVNLESERTSPGDTQALHATLHNPLGELMILTLSITYPDGQQQTVIESSLAQTGTLTWMVPATVSSGIAAYRLSAGGCGCGMGDRGLEQPPLESIAEGRFWIDQPQ